MNATSYDCTTCGLYLGGGFKFERLDTRRLTLRRTKTKVKGRGLGFHLYRKGPPISGSASLTRLAGSGVDAQEDYENMPK